MQKSTRPAGTGKDETRMIDWLFANSRDLLQIADRSGTLISVNAAWTTSLGWAEQELVGRRLQDLLHPDDIERFAAADEARAELPEMRLRAADGAWLWCRPQVLRLEDGRILGTLQRIEGKKAMSQELSELRQSRDLLGLAAGVGMWRYEPGDHRVYWSEHVLERLGFPADALGTPEAIHERLHARDRKKLAEGIARSMAGGLAQIEFRLRGAKAWFTVRATYRTEPRPNGQMALRGVIQDITEVAEARDAARRGERRMHEARREAVANARRLKLALEVAQAGVYEIDHVAKTFWASPELLRLAGAGEATYTEVTKLRYPRFHPDDLPQVRENFVALHQGSKRSGEGFEARICDSSGRERWVRIFHQLQVARNGRWLKAVGLVHDIDADKRQELALIEAQRAAEDAGEAKAAFLANMSHEIRTPMNGVLGVLQILKAEPLTPEGRTLLDEALSCGRMLAELLNDVIDFSKIEAGRLELAYEPLHPKSVIEGVIHLLRPQADGKGLTLVGHCDPAVGWVRSDPVRLRQALFNLIGNAVKFTEAGGVTVRCLPGAPGRLRFEVEDTGIGIPMASQSRVFERFDQGDASTTRRFGGSGLGLSITRRLAELMGGDARLHIEGRCWVDFLD